MGTELTRRSFLTGLGVAGIAAAGAGLAGCAPAANDSAAATGNGGKAFGIHKLAPYVSPHKTVEGAVWGAVSAFPTGVLCFYLLRFLHSPVDMLTCIVVSLIACSFGQVGDLAASLLKRMVGIKDYSNLIPGHGGMMDRADSLLFSIPVAWFCLYAANAL